MILRAHPSGLIAPARRGRIILPVRHRPLLPAWDRSIILPLHAAISVVKSSTQANQSSSVASFGTSFATLPAAGNAVLLIVCVWCSAGSTTPSVSDNQGVGNTYTLVPNSFANATGGAIVGMYLCPSIGATSGTFTVTVAFSPNNALGVTRAIEISGLKASPNDQASAFSQSTASTTRTQTNGSANANANDLVVAAITADTSSSSSGITDPPAGYSSILVQQDSVTFMGAEAAYKIVSSIETSTATWSYVSASDMAAAVATFQGAATGFAPVLMGGICL